MMRNTHRPIILLETYSSRVAAVRSLLETSQGAGKSGALLLAADEIEQTIQSIDEPAKLAYQQFSLALKAIHFLVRWAEAVRTAQLDSDRFLKAARQGAKDLLSITPDEDCNKEFINVAKRIGVVEDVEEIPSAADALLKIPLPIPIFGAVSEAVVPVPRADSDDGKREVRVAFTSFQLNGKPFNDPQTVQPNIVYDLTIEVRLSDWPEGATELLLDPLTIESVDEFRLPKFRFNKPDNEPPLLLSDTGHLLLKVPQSVHARPLSFSYHAWFSPEEAGKDAILEGHRQLMVQNYDLELDPITGYKEVDRRLIEIRDEIRGKPTINDTELSVFLVALGAVGRVAGQSLQDNTFGGNWTEAKFQKKLVELLRADPRIGSHLEEHPKAGRGITDLSYKRLKIELKVDKDRAVTLDNCRQYLGQTAQYASGSDKRLGILVVLDHHERNEVRGSVANDIALVEIPPPDPEGHTSILIGIVIIRGNLPRPSSIKS